MATIRAKQNPQKPPIHGVMTCADVLGQHPAAPNPFGIHLDAADEQTQQGLPHRILRRAASSSEEFVGVMKQLLVAHHASPEALDRDRRRVEAMMRQGIQVAAKQPGRFPTNPNTQKGNWGEIFLAEYLGSSSNARVPVYRLRYNPNVDQSMKGDDVLAFDLDSNPVRILVGEAKFRSAPSKKVVEEIVEALTKSHRAGIPVSLQFVADRLFEHGQADLGTKVERCNLLFALGQLRLDYVGLLVSNDNATDYVRKNAKAGMHHLAVMSLGLSDPEGTICSCYQGLSDQL